MALSRSVYTQGTVTIGGTGVLAQSVSFTHDQPKESVTAYGFTSAARVASGPETSTMEITFFPTGGEAAMINALAVQSRAQTPTVIDVRSNICSISGAILTSVAGEGAVGAVPTVTVSFIGGNDSGNILSAITASNAAITNIKTSADVSVNGTGCAQKASFNWSIPVQPIICLGNNISTSAEFFGNPPGTASISVEGTTSPGATTTVDIGNFAINLNAGASVSSSTASLAVGDLFGTFNTTTETVATACTFGANP